MEVGTEVHTFTVEFLCAVEIGLDIIGDNLQREGKEEEAEKLFELEREVAEQMNDRNAWWAQDAIDIALTAEQWELFEKEMGPWQTRMLPPEAVLDLIDKLEKLDPDDENLGIIVYTLGKAINRRKLHDIRTERMSITLGQDEWAFIHGMPK